MRVVSELLPRWGRVALACAGVVGLAITSWPSAALAEATSVRGTVMAPAAGGSRGRQLWVTRYSQASGTAVAASPTGGTVFVTGNVTIGYHAATGAQLWASHYDGPAKLGSLANAVTVSPDGSRVFVTGETWNGPSHPEYATIAYDASTGTRLWASLHAGYPARGAAADATAMVISPDGKVVYVTGYSGSACCGGVYDYVTIAYLAATGKALWSARYDHGGNDQASAIAISPHGRFLYVTGRSFATKTGYDYATIAYLAATGKKLWVSRYNGPASKYDSATAIAAAPDGKSVYVTGASRGKTSGLDFATIAYSAATGRQRWARRDNGPGNGDDYATGIAVSPNSATVVVTGWSTGTAGPYDTEWATIGYNAKTGAAPWNKRYGVNGVGSPSENAPEAVVINPRGGTVYVTGAVADYEAEGYYGTVAYSVSTGAQKWAQIYTEGTFSYATALAVSPDGHTLYVTGHSETDTIDMATIAYRA